MDTQFIRISDIPVYGGERSEAVFLYHVTRYQRWLSTAGASPRVAATLCSSTEKLDNLINHLEIRDVEVVPLEASDARPIRLLKLYSVIRAITSIGSSLWCLV